MTDSQSTNVTPSNLKKDPHEWTTGGEKMTDAQGSYLKTLSGEAHQELPENLTKSEASLKIAELQDLTGRGKKNDEDGNA